MTVEKVKEFLQSIGFSTFTSEQETIIETAFASVKQRICNICNLDTVPSELDYVVLYRTVGSALASLNAIGAIPSTLDFAKGIKETKIGDTDVSYISSTAPDKRFEMWVDVLSSYGAREIYSFRRMRW